MVEPVFFTIATMALFFSGTFSQNLIDLLVLH